MQAFGLLRRRLLAQIAMPGFGRHLWGPHLTCNAFLVPLVLGRPQLGHLLYLIVMHAMQALGHLLLLHRLSLNVLIVTQVFGQA